MSQITRILVLLFIFIQEADAINRCQSILTNDQSSEKFNTNEVYEAAREQGQYGGQLMFLKRKTYVEKILFFKAKLRHMKWSNYEIMPDKPGSLRWGFDFLPSSLKKLFGLKVLSNELIELSSTREKYAEILILPSADEIVQVHEKLNQILVMQKSNLKVMRYYVSDGIVAGKDYIELIAKYAALPIGTNHYLLQHDWNYHVLSGLAMPDKLIQAMQTRAKLLIEFYDYCQKNCLKAKYGARLLAEVEHSLFDFASYRLDLAGNLFSDVIRYPRMQPERMDSILDTMDSVFFKQTKPVDYLNRLLKEIRIHYLEDKAGANIELAELYQSFLKSIDQKYHEKDLTPEMFTDRRVIIGMSNQKLKELDAFSAKMKRIE